MRRTTRLSAVLFTAAALVLPGSAALAAPAGPDAADHHHPPSVAWAPCQEDSTADCGTLTVPIDWRRPSGPTVDVALARRKATNPGARIGSLVVNPGGPGGSGVDFVLYGTDFFSSELTSRFDLIGFDPRGVARSHPVTCSFQLLTQAPSTMPGNQAEFDALTAYNRRLADDCRTRTGPLYDHVDTLSVVHDIDAIRRAVGDQKLSFYGVSYGTLMGQQYAEQFPNHVRALALDSNMDHSLGTRGFLETETATAQDSFEQFVAGCQREPKCKLYGRDIRAFWRDLLARADRGEVHDPFQPDRKLTSADLINFTFGTFYGPRWFDLAEILVAVDTGVVPDGGSGSGGGSGGEALRARAARSAVKWRSNAAAAAPTEEDPPPPEAVEYAFQAVFCEDWSLPVRDYREFAGYLRQMARIAPDMRYSPLGISAVTACLGWPGKVNNPQHPLRVSPASPTLLLVNAVHDPATGYAWATDAARQLGRQAVLVTYEGWGHAAYGREPCTTGAVDRYLVSKVVPARGTRCAAAPVEPPPVDPGVAGTRSAPNRTTPVGPRPDVPGWF